MAMSVKKQTKRQIQAERTKQKLICAGIELIKNTRYDDILITDITDKCGVSKGTFYLYFDSKDQFFYSICHADYTDLGMILVDDSQPLYLERLRNYCKAWFALNETMSVYYMQHWFSHILDDEFNEKVAGSAQPYAVFKKDVCSCIQKARGNKEIVEDAPVDYLADYTMIMLYGFDVFSIISRDDASVFGRADLFADSLIDDVFGRYRVNVSL